MNVLQWFTRKGNPGQEMYIQKLQVESLIPTQTPITDISLDQWFSTRSEFDPQGTFDNAWKHFWLSQLGEVASGI